MNFHTPDRMTRSFFIAVCAALFACAAFAAPTASSATLTESDKIDALIRAVQDRSDLQFVRNDVVYSAVDAAKHLRGKLSFAGSRVKTADDFIDHIGTGSSMSGKPYFVRFLDGKQMPSADFLRQELKRIVQAPATTTAIK